MEVVNQKMQDLLLKTPERRQRDSSMLSTPGLPVVESGKGVNEVTTTVQESDLYPPSPAACAFPVVVPHRIFVGGFQPTTTEHELRCYFERFGEVRDVKIIRDDSNENTKPRYSYGFVTYSTEEEAKSVIQMNKAAKGQAFKFQGRYLNVNEAVKKPPHKLLRLDSSGVPATGLVCRDQNGQFLTVYPSYTLVPNPEMNVVQPQIVSLQPPMVPMVMQPPPTMYQLAPPQQMQPMGQMTYAQYGGQVQGPAPNAAYYQ